MLQCVYVACFVLLLGKNDVPNLFPDWWKTYACEQSHKIQFKILESAVWILHKVREQLVS